MGGFTKIPKLQETDIEEGLTPIALKGIDVDGKTVKVEFSAVPISIENDFEKAEVKLYKDSVNSTVELKHTDKVSGYTTVLKLEKSQLYLEGYSPVFQGIVAPFLYDKQNDPFAFVQLGDLGTGFQQATLSTPQAITASTPTVITLSGATTQENGGLDLIDTSNNEITPIQQGDIITIDFAFPFETPAGTNNYGYVEIREKTTGFVVREFAKNFIKGAGNDDIFSASFVLPIGSASYVTNGFEIVITTAVDITLDSKYIAVTRTHTAK